MRHRFCELPSAALAPMFESRRRFSRRRRSPLASFRRRRARHLSSTPHLSSIMPIGFSTAAAPRVNAAPPSSRRRCSSSRRSSRCLHSSGYHHSSLAALLSRTPPLLDATPPLRRSSPLLYTSPLLDATPPRRRYLFLSARVSARATRTAAYVHVLFVGLPRYCVCVRRTMRKRFAVRVS